MKGILSIIILLLSFAANAGIQCNGAIDVYSNSEPMHKKAPLEKTFHNDDFIKADTQIDEAYYSVNADLTNKSITLTISFAPDYTSGLLTKGWLNDRGEFKMTRVEGSRVYSIICNEK